MLIKCWNEEGIGPEMLFKSICNLLSFDKNPNSSGKVPDNILPFNNLYHPNIFIINYKYELMDKINLKINNVKVILY